MYNFPYRNLKTGTHTLQCSELKILLAPFQCSIVSTMHSNLIRKRLLAYSESLPTFAQRIANSLLEGPPFHGAYRKSPLLEKLHTQR